MFKFSLQQFRQIESARRADFAQRASAHVQAHYADRIAAIGEQRSLALLQQALREADELGFVSQPDAMKYVNLIFVQQGK